MTATNRLILGVDGGGTKTDACLAQVDPQGELTLLGRAQAGSSNIKAVGADTALANLGHAVNQAWSMAQLQPTPVQCAVLGLSGAGRPETQALVKHWAEQHSLAVETQVIHDALAVLLAGTPEGQGIALIAGTGAVAYAADADDQTAVIGGWGFWFGDEGSAFSLGQAAARAVAHAADGRAEPTLLTQAILERLGLAEPRGLLTALEGQGDVRSALANLADVVPSCAERHDPTALMLVHQAVEQLGALVIAAAQRQHLGHEFPLALAGGVLCHSNLVRNLLIDELAARNLHPRPVELVAEPVQGCLRLAARTLASG
jgi:N-acetylglucosamine kinase-like BadF-type ATPase